MKLSIGLSILGSIFLFSCKKENNLPDGTSVKLTALTYFKNNMDETRSDRSGALNSTSYYSTITNNGINKVFVNLGEVGTNHTQAVFGLSFTFDNKAVPDSISGTYSFPSSNAFIRVVLRNQIMPGRDETVLLPVYGKAIFQFDSNSRKLSGRIEDLEFNLLGYFPFDRNKIIINGTFENVSLK